MHYDFILSIYDTQEPFDYDFSKQKISSEYYFQYPFNSENLDLLDTTDIKNYTNVQNTTKNLDEDFIKYIEKLKDKQNKQLNTKLDPQTDLQTDSQLNEKFECAQSLEKLNRMFSNDNRELIEKHNENLKNTDINYSIIVYILNEFKREIL